MQYNCNTSGVCADPPEAPHKIGALGYVLVVLAILIRKSLVYSSSGSAHLALYLVLNPFCFAVILFLVVFLYAVHKKGSAKKRAELDEYFKEQLAYVVQRYSQGEWFRSDCSSILI